MKVEIGKYPNGKKRRVQRVKIDPWDIFSLDHTLALIIAPAMRKFKASNNGIPGSLIDFSHHETEEWNSPAFKKAERLATDRASKEWDKIIDKIVWSFDEIANDNPNEPDILKFRDKDKWKVKWSAYQARVDEGLALFGKWYGAFWT